MLAALADSGSAFPPPPVPRPTIPIWLGTLSELSGAPILNFAVLTDSTTRPIARRFLSRVATIVVANLLIAGAILIEIAAVSPQVTAILSEVTAITLKLAAVLVKIPLV